MDIVKATASWSEETGVYCLWAEPPATSFDPESFDSTGLSSILWELDEQGRGTGRVAGVELVGFLDFDEWDAAPELPILWQLPGWEPLPLDELLKRKQNELRQQAPAATRER